MGVLRRRSKKSRGSKKKKKMVMRKKIYGKKLGRKRKTLTIYERVKEMGVSPRVLGIDVTYRGVLQDAILWYKKVKKGKLRKPFKKPTTYKKSTGRKIILTQADQNARVLKDFRQAKAVEARKALEEAKRAAKALEKP